MKDEKMRELMIDYIEGNLSGELGEFVEKYINKSAANRKEYESLQATIALLEQDRQLEPDSSLRSQFMDALNQAIAEEKEVQETKHHFLGNPSRQIWQVAAAAAILIIGVMGGMWYMQNKNNEAQMRALQKEMESTKQMVMMALENQHSASQRMMGVNASYDIKEVDHDIVNALVKTMNEDDNVNVRLAAVNALAKFSDSSQVRQALISS
ncbi:MAG: hypothetical protein R3345_01080, partial [Fulvivirga sp.]|nr:hypothetical protein [Fulvivirga sp.]